MFSPTITDDAYDSFYLISNILFLIDSLAYYVGYLIFVLDLRSALLTGKVPVSQTGAIA
jgi:hypothetical protein